MSTYRTYPNNKATGRFLQRWQKESFSKQTSEIYFASFLWLGTGVMCINMAAHWSPGAHRLVPSPSTTPSRVTMEGHMLRLRTKQRHLWPPNEKPTARNVHSWASQPRFHVKSIPLGQLLSQWCACNLSSYGLPYTVRWSMMVARTMPSTMPNWNIIAFDSPVLKFS